MEFPELKSPKIINEKRSRFLITVLVSTLGAALLTGGGMYAYQHSQQVRMQKDLQNQIDSLESQLAESKAATASPTFSPAAATTPASTPTASPTSANTSSAPITIEAATEACQKETKITSLKDAAGDPFTLCASKQAAMGDLSGDGVADVVIPVASDSGPSQGEKRLAVFLSLNGAAQFAGISKSFHSSDTLQSLTVTGGKIEADMTTTNPGLPTLTRTFALENGAVVDQTTF